MWSDGGEIEENNRTLGLGIACEICDVNREATSTSPQFSTSRLNSRFPSISTSIPPQLPSFPLPRPTNPPPPQIRNGRPRSPSPPLFLLHHPHPRTNPPNKSPKSPTSSTPSRNPHPAPNAPRSRNTSPPTPPSRTPSAAPAASRAADG